MVRFLDSLAESLHRQVFLEAKIMEVVLDDSYKYGIDWSSMNVGFTSDSSALPDSLNISFNSGGAIALANQSSLNMILDFLRTQGDVSVDDICGRGLTKAGSRRRIETYRRRALEPVCFRGPDAQKKPIYQRRGGFDR